MRSGHAYTEPIIKGTRHTNMLPQGTALILEGGGTRGYYTAGVFEAFMDKGIMFPYIAGVSAGAANALTYVSGQRGRSRVIAEKYVNHYKYMGFYNILRYRSMFGFDFIFNEIPQRHVYWDDEVFDGADVRLLTGATDCKTGKTIWYEKGDIKADLTVVRASCAVPFATRIVRYEGLDLIDGGVSDPIPIEKSIEDGNTFHVVILTRNQGYTKPPLRHKGMLKLFYKKYPALMEIMLNRHKVYDRQLALCERLEREGKAIIIRPLKPLEVSRTGKDVRKLLALYDEGHEEGALAVRRMEELLSKMA